MEPAADIVYEGVNVARVLRLAYWLLTGALLGIGLIAILSIGAPILLLGLILLIFGAIRLGGSGLWAAAVAFGSIPALILLYDVTSAPWACLSAGQATTTTTTSQPNVSYYTCFDTPVGQLSTYHILAIGFGIIALVGIAWPLLRQILRRGGGR